MPERLNAVIVLVLWAAASTAQSCPEGTTRTATSYGSYCAPISALSPGSTAQIRCLSPSTEVTLHGSATPGLPILDILHCGEQVSILGKEDEWYRVHTNIGKDGYVREIFVAAPPAVPSEEESESAVVKEIPPGTVIKQPTRMPTTVNQPKSPSSSQEYSLMLKVLQTEQVPYVVQYGGGQVSTSCSINGTTTTTGTAIASGNVAFGNATSYSNLSMNCNSYQSPPMAWRHVLNAMLVVASNGNAYIMACDAAWRWSKCRGLVIGDTFRAKMVPKGLAVEYFDNKGKSKEATYAILQAKVLGN